MSDLRLGEIDRRIADMRKRLAAAEQVRQAMADDPELVDLLIAGHQNGTAAGASSFRKPKRKPERQFHGGAVTQEYFKKVATFLESKGNKPYTIPDIAREVGLKPSNIIQLFYRTHVALVQSLPVAGHKTRKQWRLKSNWKELLEGAS